MHGDKVVARITRDERYSRAQKRPATGPRAASFAFSNARTTPSSARLQQSKNFFYVVPDDPRIVHNVYVQMPPQTAAAEDTEPRRQSRRPSRAVGIAPRQSRRPDHRSPRARVPRPAWTCFRSSGSTIFRRNFRAPSSRKREQIPETVGEEMFEGREDLRDQFIVTIDPDDARDFDDAINVERIPGGGWSLGVHIADVAAYVKPGAALDREAYKRGNSVYLPDRVIPMLPERLSNGVCSLKPDVNRLTHSVFIQFTKDGRAKSVRFARTVIRSARRLTYREAYAILQRRAQRPAERAAACRLGTRLAPAQETFRARLARSRFPGSEGATGRRKASRSCSSGSRTMNRIN